MEAGKFVNEKLATSVPWEDLVSHGNLQKILHAIVQRLDRFDRTLAPGAVPLAVIPAEEIVMYRERIDVLENLALQNQLQSVQGELEGLTGVALQAKRKISMAKHVIPLVHLKAKVDSFDSALAVTAIKIDDANATIAKLATEFDKEIKAAIKELKILEEKHEALVRRVEELARDIFERIQKRINELQADVDRLGNRIDATDHRVAAAYELIDRLDASVLVLAKRITPLEEIMPTKADRVEMEKAIQELKDEIKKLNIEEMMKMVKRANERIDLMDIRCDKMEDEAGELKKFVHRFAQEMEDMQLQKQIENLRRELQEAKTGVFLKATERMDVMQLETNELKSLITQTQGQVQFTRESVGALEEFMRDKAGFDKGPGDGGTKAHIAQLRADVVSLQERFADIASVHEQAASKNSLAVAAIDGIIGRLEELDRTKINANDVKDALENKADKEMVARETELNQRVVDDALRTMNSGTQGIQQLLERQEGAVSSLNDKMATKPSFEDIERLEEELRRAKTATDPSAELEKIYSKYGANVDDAAGMRRPMNKYNCISCNRPVEPSYSNATPALPLLPPGPTGRQVPYASSTRRLPDQVAQGRNVDGSLVDMSGLNSSLRSAGGAHTTPRYTSANTQGRKLSLSTELEPLPPTPGTVHVNNARIASATQRPVEVVGEDGKMYHGRMRSAVGMANRTPAGSAAPSPVKP